VVVSAPGSSEELAECLESLARQSLPPEFFEVVVALHGPGSEAERALERVRTGALSRHDVKLVDERAETSAAARNLGVQRARGSWTALVDGRDTVSSAYLECLYDARHPEHVPAARLCGTVVGAADDGGHHVAPERAVDLARARGGKLIPTSWLRETPLVPQLTRGGDAVQSGHLYSRFDHQFTTFDLEPGRLGADYRMSAAAEPGDDFEHNVCARLAAVAALTTGTQSDPADRSSITTALVAAELADLRHWLERHPEHRPRAERAVRDAAIPGVSSLRAGGHDGPAEGFALFHTPPPGGRGLVVVAGSARAINDHARMIMFLSRAGFGVRALHYRGGLVKMLRKLPDTHRVELLPKTVPWVESRVRAGSPRSHRAARRASREAMRVGRRLLPELVPARLGRPAYSRLDNRAAALLAEPGPRVVLDREGAVLLRAYGDDSANTALDGHQLALLTMRTAASQFSGSLADAHAARAASRLLTLDPARSRAEAEPGLWAMVGYRLQRVGRLQAAEQVFHDCRNLFGDNAIADTGMPALDALQHILTDGDRDAVDVPQVVRRTLADADAALSDDPERAAFLTTVALDLQFTRRLHTAELSSPIVSDPATFLAPLRDSEVGRLLSSTTPGVPLRAGTTARTTHGRPRVTLLPGAYPKFAKVVAEELGTVADVEVLDLAERQKRFTNPGVDPVTVRERLLAATGHPPVVDVATAEALAADVVFVDWADKGLTWVTQVVPPGTRVVVRMHGVDTLSAWLHTAEWSKVTDAIFPAEHLRRAAVAALGERLDHVRLHVVPNPVHVDRYRQPKTAAAAKTLGMVGWAQQVKDPQWALDVLAELRRHDPQWRLRLIGKDFAVSDSNPVERAAAAAFHQRVTESSLWDNVDYVGYTTRLPDHLNEVGWALSTSRRESFHIGLVEMAASGAVPVVRDWPVYAGLDGATGLFPRDWVVATPREAARRILTISGEGGWEAASAETLETVRERFSAPESGSRLRQIVLGQS
jgi:glycosyltransferase involved in cell wall biosynthesis